ncbi:uncharacterized protein LOC107036713 [Diachasma alloeum]|uniref:uncharacterized protein LOC107036713 n=1 Tax=Diachasma alloeum TaxID=454923 RepID=UPI00073830BF|nr:uncharacterized protein LOC107036713 [Diachasma alloeum]
MTNQKKRKFLLFASCLSLGVALVSGNSSVETCVEERILSRQKRYLLFPEGSNVQCVFCLTIGSLPRPTDLVLGLTAALAWELPHKVDKKLTKLLHRQSRSTLFPRIEAFLQSTGLDGRSCVLRALCEAGQRSREMVGKGTFVQELLHSIFRLRHDGHRFDKFEHRVYDSAHESTGDCAKDYPTCKHSIYELDL